MKIILMGLLFLYTLNTYAAVSNSENSLLEIQIRSGDYYASDWNDGITLLVSPKISISGCNADRVYLNAKTDAGMLSALLAAKAQNKTVKLLINSARVKSGLCKVEMVTNK